MKWASLVVILLTQNLSWASSIPIESVSGRDLLTSKELTLRPKDHPGGLVVVFLSARCPCSQSHVDALRSLAGRFPGYAFVGVHSNSDEPLSEAERVFEKAHLPFPLIEDQDAKLANRFSALKTPHAYVLNSLGEVVYRGGVSSSRDYSRARKKYLEEALLDLQAGQKVRNPETRTLGCVIKRGD